MGKKRILVLATLIALVLGLGGVVAIGGAVRAGQAARSLLTEAGYRRKQLELYPAGLVMYAYERSYQPLAKAAAELRPATQDPRQPAVEADVPMPNPTRRSAEKGSTSIKRRISGKSSTSPVVPTPGPTATSPFHRLLSVQSPVTPLGEWYRRPVKARWAQYVSDEWAPVRNVNRGVLVGFPALLAFVALWRRKVAILKGAWFLVMLPFAVRRLRPGTSHGSAMWADPRAVRELRPRRRDVGFRVGTVDRRPIAIPGVEQREHGLVVAPPGAGKTTALIEPNLLREPGVRSIIATDPKRELIRHCAPELARRGHDVWLVDFMDPEVSRGYNPLSYVRDAYGAQLFAEAWVKNTGTSDKEPFWDRMAETLISAVALHLVETEDAPPLTRLRDVLCRLTPDEVSAMLSQSPVEDVRDLETLIRTMSLNERMLGSVFAGMPQRFNCLRLEQVKATTSVNEIEFQQLAHVPTALFLGFDFKDREALAPLNGCFFLHLFLTMQEEAKRAGGVLPTEVRAYLDEFGNIGAVPSFESHITLVRSTGFGCYLVLQSLAQLERVYGEEAAQIIKGACSAKMCLGRLSGEDAEYFTELAGKATVVSRNKNSSRPTLVPWVTSGNKSQAEAQRDLITTDELRKLTGKVLLVSGARPPMLAELRSWYEDPRLAVRVPDVGRYDALREFGRERLGLPDLEVPKRAVGRMASTGGELGGAAVSTGERTRATRAGNTTLPAPAHWVNRPRPELDDLDVGEWDSPRKPTAVLVGPQASGGTPSGTERPAQPVGPQPGGPEGPNISPEGGPEGPELDSEDVRLLEGLARGLTPGKLAMRWGVDVELVRAHSRELCSRLGVSEPADAVLAARSLGLLRARDGREL